MKPIRVTPFVAAFVLAGASSTVRAQSATVQALLAIDSAWTRSYATHDTALAIRVMAPDIVITSSNGATKDRAKELEDVKPYPGMAVNYFRSANVRVVERGAVVIGTLEWETVSNGRTSAIRRRYTATYAKGGPLGWQMVALHIGQAPPNGG